MKKKDIEHYIERYSERLEKFGYSPETLGWGKSGRQEVRFSVLAELAIKNPESSVLDVGCGFGDLYFFLKSNGWRGHYTGIDIVPGLLEEGRKKYPEIDLRQIDITSEEHSEVLSDFDFVISSGAFNAKLEEENNDDHIRIAIKNMLAHSLIAVSCDFMSTYVDFKHPVAWHTDPCFIFNLCKNFSKRVVINHSYMPYEFSVTIFRQDNINSRNVFSAVDNEK
jgi:SAM-dependent methyltransferase